jgi:prepilin-type N-terminal cleavage/methylation domain-containing protein
MKSKRKFAAYLKMRIHLKDGFTLLEVVIAISLFLLLMIAAYRLFFAEVRSIRTALEHIGVNESARKFFAYMGNDVRNANWLEYPKQTNRQTVSVLYPINEGKVCVLIRQKFDFQIKPPDPSFVKTERIEYFLKKAKDGTSDLYRKVDSEIGSSGVLSNKKKFEKKICGGIKDLLVYTTSKKPVTITNFSAGLPFKSLLNFEPYDLDGTGPYLLHVRATFVRKGSNKNKGTAHHVNTCFCIRGRWNGVHP